MSDQYLTPINVGLSGPTNIVSRLLSLSASDITAGVASFRGGKNARESLTSATIVNQSRLVRFHSDGEWASLYETVKRHWHCWLAFSWIRFVCHVCPRTNEPKLMCLVRWPFWAVILRLTLNLSTGECKNTHILSLCIRLGKPHRTWVLLLPPVWNFMS